MATRGYDDTTLIAQIDELMASDRSIKQRAAIIQIAGESNLRRLEKKLARRRHLSEEPDTTQHLPVPVVDNPIEAVLLLSERQALQRSGETVRWSATTSGHIVEERRLHAALGSDHRERRRRIKRGQKASAAAFVGMVTITAIYLLATLGTDWLGKAGYSLNLPHSVVVALCIAVLLSVVLLGAFSMIGFWISDTAEALMDVRLKAYLKKHPSSPGDLRRFTLTDKAFYVFTPSVEGVHVLRMNAARLRHGYLDPKGDVEVFTERSQALVSAAPDTERLLSLLSAENLAHA